MVTVWQAPTSIALRQMTATSSFAHGLVALLAILLVVAVATDLRARIIPNWLNLAIALLALPWWIAVGLTVPEILLQIGLFAGALLLFAGAFAIGMMGGGDVKMIAALALWLPPAVFGEMLVWMALAGGVLTIAMLVRHRWRRDEGKPEIPYGVAISAATLLVLANDILTGRAA